MFYVSPKPCSPLKAELTFLRPLTLFYISTNFPSSLGAVSAQSSHSLALMQLPPSLLPSSPLCDFSTAAGKQLGHSLTQPAPQIKLDK